MQRNYLCDIYRALDLGSLPLDNLHYGVLLQERKTLDSTSYVYLYGQEISTAKKLK